MTIQHFSFDCLTKIWHLNFYCYDLYFDNHFIHFNCFLVPGHRTHIHSRGPALGQQWQRGDSTKDFMHYWHRSVAHPCQRSRSIHIERHTRGRIRSPGKLHNLSVHPSNQPTTNPYSRPVIDIMCILYEPSSR